jgi:hypothetical protein
MKITIYYEGKKNIIRHINQLSFHKENLHSFFVISVPIFDLNNRFYFSKSFNYI